MNKVLVVSLCVCLISCIASADTFGTGANEFNIDFVPISGGTNPTSGYGIVNNDYRMGTYEITNDQWGKFTNAYGIVTGNPLSAYNENPDFTGSNVPMNEVSWYETAQFVNWLNTSKGYQPAYKFTGTQGSSDYAFTAWDVSNTGYNSSNPYRNSNAYYFLPTQDEWIKAAYWNGFNLQSWATLGDVVPTQSGWNFYDNSYSTDPYGPWDVGSGSLELNGTFDMMGNVFEWMENPYPYGNYLPDSSRSVYGGAYLSSDFRLSSSYQGDNNPVFESAALGFRIASIPEPTTLSLLAVGALGVLRRRK